MPAASRCARRQSMSTSTWARASSLSIPPWSARSSIPAHRSRHDGDRRLPAALAAARPPARGARQARVGLCNGGSPEARAVACCLPAPHDDRRQSPHMARSAGKGQIRSRPRVTPSESPPVRAQTVVKSPLCHRRSGITSNRKGTAPAASCALGASKGKLTVITDQPIVRRTWHKQQLQRSDQPVARCLPCVKGRGSPDPTQFVLKVIGLSHRLMSPLLQLLGRCPPSGASVGPDGASTLTNLAIFKRPGESLRFHSTLVTGEMAKNVLRCTALSRAASSPNWSGGRTCRM